MVERLTREEERELVENPDYLWYMAETYAEAALTLEREESSLKKTPQVEGLVQLEEGVTSTLRLEKKK